MELRELQQFIAERIHLLKDEIQESKTLRELEYKRRALKELEAIFLEIDSKFETTIVEEIKKPRQMYEVVRREQ